MALDIKNINRKAQKPEKKKKVIGKHWLSGLLNRDIHLFGSGLSDRKKESFYSELAILLSSGIDIRTSLEIIVEEQVQAAVRELFSQVYQQVISGKSLSESLLNTGKFSSYEYYSLKIGEESGKIKEVLGDLTIYFTKRIRQRRQLASALTYPILVIITACLAVFFMLKFIVPMFTEVFKRFQGGLPPLTKLIISFSESFSRNAFIILFILLVIIITAWILKKRTWYRNFSTLVLLRLPLFGKIINKVYLARFCQSMALLMGAKTPMLQAIQLVRNMIRFYPFERALEILEDDILHGKLLNESMQHFSIFDKRIIALTRVAEEVNQLDKVYAKLNTQYSEELEHQIGIIGNVLEPSMIIIVGLLVAVILISMYLPLFQLSTNII